MSKGLEDFLIPVKKPFSKKSTASNKSTVENEIVVSRGISYKLINRFQNAYSEKNMASRVSGLRPLCCIANVLDINDKDHLREGVKLNISDGKWIDNPIGFTKDLYGGYFDEMVKSSKYSNTFYSNGVEFTVYYGQANYTDLYIDYTDQKNFLEFGYCGCD